MEEMRCDAIVVGAGPAGIAAAMTIAQGGLEVIVLERGSFAGAKNVMGGILYAQPTAEVLPGIDWSTAPVERHIIEQRYWLLTEDSHIGLSYRTQAFDAPNYNAFSVMRAEWDQWFAAQAEEMGVFIIPEMTVTDVVWKDGAVVGVKTSGGDELFADVVIIADGANSLLAQTAGMHKEWQPKEQALVTKELIRLGEDRVRERFNLQGQQGLAMEIFGQSTSYLLGYGFIYTNKDTISIGSGALLQDLIDVGVNVNDMLERFKQHPSVAALIEGGETIEYAAHLIPEGGWHSLPQLYIDGALLCGDAAMLVNPLNREGSNFAMLSGVFAGQTVLRAKERGDFHAATLSYYRELLDDSFIMKDLYKIRNVTDFAHSRPYLLTDVPEAISQALREYLRVDSVPKKDKQAKMIAGMRKAMPMRRTVRDMLAARKVMT